MLHKWSSLWISSFLLLLLLLVPSFLSQNCQCFWTCVHYLFVRGNPPHTFPVFLLLLPFVLSIFVTVPPSNTQLCRLICFCLSFFSSPSASPTLLAVFLSSYYTGSFLAAPPQPGVWWSPPVTETSMGIWVQRGDGGWKGETVASLWLTHVLFCYWLASCHTHTGCWSAALQCGQVSSL